MDRIIGIDYGRKRTGVAVSDPLGVFASALDTVRTANLIDYLKNYAESSPIGLFVVGWPTNMDGKPSEAAADVKVCLKNLEKNFPDIPAVTEDERFTSVLAHRAMIDGGMKYSQRRDKTSVDKISAAIILQSYLDRKNREAAQEQGMASDGTGGEDFAAEGEVNAEASVPLAGESGPGALTQMTPIGKDPEGSGRTASVPKPRKRKFPQKPPVK